MLLRMSRLLGNSGSLPSSITNAVRQTARSGNGALVIERAATKEEREALAASGEVAGLNRRGPSSQYVQEQIGQLEGFAARSEEHTSELQVTNAHLVCRLLLEKKNNSKQEMLGT